MSSSESTRRGTRSHSTAARSSDSRSSSSRSSSSSRASSARPPSSTRSSNSRTPTSRSGSSRSTDSRSASSRPTASHSSRPHSSSRPTASRSSRPHSSSRARSQTREETSTSSVFETAVSQLASVVWRQTKMAFSGEVPNDLRTNKITSKDAHRRIKKRLRWSLAFLSILLVVISARVVSLQTFNRAGYFEASVEQRTRVNIIRAARGVIFDRKGNEIALSVPSVTVYADPREIVDPVATARALAPFLRLTPEKEAAMAASFAKAGSKFLYISREMLKEDAAVLTGLGLSGIYSYTEPSRQIEGGVAQALIGKTDPDGLGTSGLELQFNDVLTGIDGRTIREVDERGRSIAGANNTKSPPVPGDDLVLTIDRNIQFHTDAELLARVNTLGAKGGTAIVMDTVTGEIYAMSNVRRSTAGAAVLATGNFAAVEAYEPGSVAKVFSISAAINEGVVTPDTSFQVPGSRTVDGFLIRDAWPHGVIEMNVRSILVESSNIGTIMAAEKISPQRLHNYLAAFGFGTKTDLGYPGESRGILAAANKWRGTEKLTVSYGYGLAATPLQLIAGVNTVANKGTYVSPRLVSATIDKSGKRHPVDASTTRPVLAPATAETMISMMSDVVCKGTGSNAKVKGMQIAGKTGTGYKVQGNGTYTTDGGGRRYFASFAGFFPAANPRVTMLVSIDEPDASSRDRFGSTAAAPVFSRLVPTVMHELGIEATGTGTGCPPGSKAAGH
jgi:cell division protein FtsI (penicillin-binding protein 3)